MLHNGTSRRVAIVGGVRIPFARSHTAYRDASNLDMMTATLKALVERYDLAGQTLGDVSLGAVIKHSRDWNLAREAVLGSGLSRQTPAFDLQRACGTSLSGCVMVANKIALGQIDAGIGAGTDTVSDPPIVYPDDYRKLMMASYRGRSFGQRIKPWLGLRPRHFKPVLPGVEEPRTGLSMGQSTELTAKAWNIDRESQDKWPEYTEAKEAMFFYTDTADAPWTVVKSDDKKRARLNCMQHFLSVLEYPGKDPGIVVGPDPLIVGSSSQVIERDRHLWG